MGKFIGHSISINLIYQQEKQQKIDLINWEDGKFIMRDDHLSKLTLDEVIKLLERSIWLDSNWTVKRENSCRFPRAFCQFMVKTGSSISAIWQSRTMARKDIETLFFSFHSGRLVVMGIIINPSLKGHWQFKERENNKRCSKVLDLVIIRSPTVVMSKSFLIATGEGGEGEEMRVKGSR